MGELQERCQIEMTLSLQPVHLLISDTRKEGKTLYSEVERERQTHKMKSRDPNLNSRVGIFGKFMDRRHLRHLRQLGGNHKHGKNHKNDMNGKESKNDMDGENGKNKCSIFDSSFDMINLLKVRGP